MVISRFGPSTLHQRDPRSALFDSYTGDRNRTNSASPAGRAGSGYGYVGAGSGSGVGVGSGGTGMGQVNGGFRAATPNSRCVEGALFGSGHWRRKKEEEKRELLFDMFGVA